MGNLCELCLSAPLREKNYWMIVMKSIDRDEALALLQPERREELRERAHEVTEKCVEKRFDFCSIINSPQSANIAFYDAKRI